MTGENDSPVLVSDIIYKSMPYALQCGISYSDFWDLDFKELRLVLTVQKKQEEELLKQKLILAHTNALFVGLAYQGKLDAIYNYFPDLFQEEKEHADTQKIKAMFAQYAAAQNKKVIERGDSNINR